MKLEGCRTTFRVHSTVSGLLTIVALVFSPFWCLKTMNQWLGQYSVQVRRASIWHMLESVAVRLARTSNVVGILERDV